VPTDRPLGLAFVGCGYIAGLHLRAARRLGPTCLVGAADVHEPSARAFVERAGEGEVLSLPALVAHDDVDVIYVCTPHDVRSEPVVGAAREGRTVLCEKPLALTSSAARALADELGPDATRVALGFNQRFMAGPSRLRSALRETAVAPAVLTVDVVSPRFLDGWAGLAERGGGVFVGLGSHAVDLVRYLTGQSLRDVRGVGARVRLEEPFLEDVATIVGRLPTGGQVTITAHDSGSDWWSMDLRQLLRIRAFAGAVIFDGGVSDLRGWDATAGRAWSDPTPAPDFLTAWGYVDMNRAVRAWALTGERDDRLAGVDDGLAVAVAVDAAMDDARRGAGVAR
jgi:predicted dehydrogenase